MTEPTRPADFIRQLVHDDNASGRFAGRVQTRFPPEPNGYLHLGHCKAICVDWGVAQENGGTCVLRFDDTNPETESPEFVESIVRDVEWLGFKVGDQKRYASDYFTQLFDFAVEMVRQGRAYVDSASETEIREARGTVNEPGRPTAFRDRSIEENLDLFARMAAGEFDDGAHVLRFKGDLTHANMKLRDPLMYRIRKAHHYRTADKWCVYPMYDWAHGLSDAIEGTTHSICTLEFQNNRALYDLFVDAVGFPNRPYQIEMARLAVTHVQLSKRKLIALVDEGHVRGWDDPRMPTLAGFRRRGVRPQAVRAFVEGMGVAKTNSVIDHAVLDQYIRDDLNPIVPRVMAILDPLPLVLENWDEGKVDWLDAPLYPHNVPLEGTRKVPFGETIFIDRADFAEAPPKGWRRLVVGGEVRLRYGYIIRCTGITKDEDGIVTSLQGTVDHGSRGGEPEDGRTVKGTIQWVSASHGKPAEVRLYDRLFKVESPGQADDWRTELSETSLVRKLHAVVEPSIADDAPGSRYQFERLGYFCRDAIDGVEALVFNRTIPLRDSWAKARRATPAPAAQPKKKKPSNKKTKTAPTLSPAETAAVQVLVQAHGVSAADALVLSRDAPLQAFFERAVEAGGDPKGVANVVVNDLRAAQKDTALSDLPITPVAVAGLVRLTRAGTINSRAAKEVFATLLTEGGEPAAIVRDRGLAAVTDPAAIAEMVDAVLAKHPEELAAFRAGKTKLQGFFVGQAMRHSGGRADPRLLKQTLAAKLKG
jgi:glutaminyl-tRNA synthetase